MQKRRRRPGGLGTIPRLLLIAAAAALGACGSSQESAGVDAAAHVVDLPDAADEIDFDDISYSPRLRRVLVPTGESGLYLVEPKSGKATRLEGADSVDSADEGRGLLFLLDREKQTISVIDPANGKRLSSASTAAPPDYVRYAPSTDEIWVSEPGASPPGIEVFALRDEPTATPRRVAFIAVPDGPEGLTINSPRRAAYTHVGSDLVSIDLEQRTITSRWPTGCHGTHGFPRVDDRDGLALAGCADNGEVSLLDLDDQGRQLGRYKAGGGEALPAYSQPTGHFYARGDPGTRIATLEPSRDGLKLIREVEVPQNGHCLTADGLGHYWTCDADHGRVRRFDDR